tara:strand:- start:3 stop:539 length:537 start_codon:yes stop_codon:yes gene_type:complete
MSSTVLKGQVFPGDGQVIAALGLPGFLCSSDHLGFDAELPGYLDHLPVEFGEAIDLEPVTHVVDLVHLHVRGARNLLDFTEEGGDFKEVVLYVVNARTEAKALGLSASRAMDQPENTVLQFGNESLDHGKVGSRGAQEGFPYGKGRIGKRISHAVRTAVEILRLGSGVKGFRILISVM